MFRYHHSTDVLTKNLELTTLPGETNEIFNPGKTDITNVRLGHTSQNPLYLTGNINCYSHSQGPHPTFRRVTASSLLRAINPKCCWGKGLLQRCGSHLLTYRLQSNDPKNPETFEMYAQCVQLYDEYLNTAELAELAQHYHYQLGTPRDA